MRDSLTVLAILLITLLTAALIAPHVIDWSSHRALIEAKLSEAAGVRIAIDGPIDVKLLPAPTVRLGRVTIGDAADGQQSLAAERIKVEVSLTALMRGDVQIVDATIEGPRIEVAAGPDGTLTLPWPSIAADPQRVRFQHLSLTHGTVSVTDPVHGSFALSGLDLDGEATTLAGPFRFTGQFGPADERSGFRLSTGAYEGGRIRLKLAVDAAGERPSVDLDGIVTARKPPGPDDTRPSGPSFEGTLALAGALALPATTASIPWRLTTRIAVDPDRADLTGFELRAGANMRALVASGSGDATFAARPAIRLRVRGTQIALDTLASVPEGPGLAAPLGLDLVRRLWRMAADPRATLDALPAILDLDYAFDSIVAGPQALYGIGGHLRLDGANPAEVRLAASGPDGARLSADGRLEFDTMPVFRGRLDASLRDLPQFAVWLAPSLPDVSDWLRHASQTRAFSFGGTVDLSEVGGAARNATLALDRTALEGTFSYTRAVGSERPRLFADLRAKTLDLDDMPNVDAGSGWSDLDLDVALTAQAIRIGSGGTGAPGAGSIDAGELALHLRKTGEVAELERFAADLGKAHLTATGSLDGSGATVRLAVDAPDLGPVARLLGHVVPGPLAAAVASRASALSPARLNLALDAARASDGSLLPTVLKLDGTANGTDLQAELKPDHPGDLDPATASVTARLLATAPRSLVLLRQIGLPVVANTAGRDTSDQGRIEATASGSISAGFETSVEAALSGTALSFRGKARPEIGQGHLSLKGADLAPLLAAAGLLTGTDAVGWPIGGDVDLSWHDRAVALRHASGRLAGVGFNGDLTIDLGLPSGSQTTKPALFGTLSLERLDLADVFGLALGTPGARAAQPEPGIPLAASQWSDKLYGAAPLRLPRTEIAVKIGRFRLFRAIEARAASLTLRADAGAITLADLTGIVLGGTLGGWTTLRHDGPVASLVGIASFNGVAIDLPGLTARIGGSLDLAGTGMSPAALVTSLAGAGSVILTDARIASLDPGALGRTARSAEQNGSEVDADQVRGNLVSELDRSALPVGNVAGQATLAAGVLRLGPFHAEGDTWTADSEASLDVKSLDIGNRTVVKVRQPLGDWKGEPAQVTVDIAGPPLGPKRTVDAVAFINALQSRAIARDQERIDVIQQDIRERAFFNRRLKSIEADQKTARDKARAEADARAADLDRQLDQQRLTKPLELDAPKGPGSTGSTALPGRPLALPGARTFSPAGPASPGPKGKPLGLRPSAPPPNAGQAAPVVPRYPDLEGRY